MPRQVEAAPPLAFTCAPSTGIRHSLNFRSGKACRTHLCSTADAPCIAYYHA